MSLGVHSPRRSALGVDWCEDFSRGRLGVRKNQGTINGVVPFMGKWVEFDGNPANYIQYPHRLTQSRSEFTIICTHKDTPLLGATRVMIGQGSSVAWPANMEFMLYLNNSDRPAIFINIVGVGGIGLQASTPMIAADERQTAVTWATNDNLRIYTDGEPDGVGVLQPGTIADLGNALIVGNRTDLGVPFTGKEADLNIDFRCWSADEIRNYYRRSLFH